MGSDLFKCNGIWYIVLQVRRLLFLIFGDFKVRLLSSGAVIARLTNIFARHEILLRMRTDGGTQFTSDKNLLTLLKWN